MRGFFLGIFLILSFWVNAQHGDTASFKGLSELAQQLSKSGNTDSALLVFNQAVTSATGQMDSVKLVEYLTNSGKDFEQTGHYTLSLVAYTKSIQIAQQTGQNEQLGLSHLGLSNVNFRIANQEKALFHSIEAAKVFLISDDTSNYITASMLIGQVYISMEKYDEALTIYQSMLDMARGIGDSILMADNLDHIGVIYGFRKQYDRALPFHQNALEINQKIDNTFHQSINYANIGELYMRQKKYEASITHLNKGLELAKSIQFRSLLIFIHYTLGECYSEMGQSNLAINHFGESIQLIQEVGEHRELPYVYNLISQHYERNQDDQKALEYYKKYGQIQDSLNTLTKNLQTEELKALYEMDKKEEELKSIRLEKMLQGRELEISKSTIRLQYLVLALFILGLVCSVLFTIIFYRNQKNLKQANNTKDVLFSIIGHDLKGPVGNIKKLIELTNQSDAQEKDKILRLLKKPADASYNLLNDLLEWSKSINNKLDYRPKQLQVRDIILNALNLFEREIEQKNITIENHVNEEVITFADSNHIYTIIRNLLSNAIKFTPTGGRIKIDSIADNDYQKIMITDTGVGIEKHLIKRIIDGNSIHTTYGTNDEKGSGLGLLLCKEFIKINQGTFGIESTVGKGSTFYFTLPKVN